MHKLYAVLIAASLNAGPARAQSVQPSARDTTIRVRPLAEVVVTHRKLLRYRRRANTSLPVAHYVFDQRHERHAQYYDSSFYLTPVPALSSQAVRLRDVRLRLPAWDTTRMRLNFIVLQAQGTDTFYTVLPIPMQVHGRSMRLELDDIELQAAPFWIGYSFTAFRIPELFYFRMYMQESKEGRFMKIEQGRPVFSDNNPMPQIFPFELHYEEI